MYLLSMFFLSILLILDLSFRFFIGMEARKESRGGKAWPGYIVLAGILGVMLSLYILLDVKNLFADMSSLLDNIAALLVDLTSAVNLFQLVAAARKVRRLTGEGGETCR